MSPFEIVVIGILLVLLLLSFICTKRILSSYGNSNDYEEIDSMDSEIAEDIISAVNKDQKELSEALSKNIVSSLQIYSNMTENKFDILTRSLNDNFKSMRQENTSQIERIRESVNEKLDKTINSQFEKSFKGVIEQMTNLQTTMGELRSISTQVHSLEKALNGVKTRGIVGEVQLRQLIMDCLTPNQYDLEVPTIPGSSEHVEVAVKLPSREGLGMENFFYLPIDSKCHIDKYERLVDAYDSGNKDDIRRARKEFSEALKNDAYAIADKYVRPPFTAPYGILFVPFEGMYSEIVNLDLLDYFNGLHITIAGPYTLMAILSTVSNYWQAFAIEKKSNEIEKTLSLVKKEFTKFNELIDSARRNLENAESKLEKLQTTRTNAILRALKDVSTLGIEDETSDDDSSDELIE